jgi:hypothetical protein
MTRHLTVSTLHTKESHRDLKPVRIDHRTVIMVSKNIPDAEAREKFFLKLEENRNKYDTTKYDRSWERHF